MSDHPAILVENLTFRYRDRQEPAIRDIDLTLSSGELLLLAGTSGSGKTTLLRCLNGLIPRSYKGELSGKIQIQGQEVSGMRLAEVSQLVGTVLQDPERQILGSRVRNEVAFGLENLGLPRAEIIERVDGALDYLNIPHLRERETFNLSGGEKQKVALAGVLAMRPKILLLDEPLASLDPASAQETLKLVRRMVDEGLSILLIEHRVEDVLKIHPDRVLYLTDGQRRYFGPVQGLMEVVDYREIKLPARQIIERAKEAPAPQPLDVLPSTRGKPAETLVEFEDVEFGYESGKEVLHGVSLSIRRGDIIAVLGPNGAGKTTLVKHAIGLLKPKSGRVYIGGQETRNLSVAQIAKTLGYVFQSPSHMLFAPTVAEELAFGPVNLGHAPETIQKEVAEAIEIVHLTGHESDPPLSLSFGQQKRVSIAAILAMRSKVLVMDEPTAGQDYRNYLDFMDSILELPGIEAILFITHDIDLAVIYANRVLLVNDGRIAADGKPEEVLNDLDRLVENRLAPTSLLQVNLESYPQTKRFVRAETLAHLIGQPG